MFKRYGSLPPEAVDLKEAKALSVKNKEELKKRRKALKATVEGRPLPKKCAGMHIKKESAASQLVKVNAGLNAGFLNAGFPNLGCALP